MAQNQIFSATRGHKIAYSLATFGNSLVGAVFTVFTFYFYKNVVYQDLLTTETQAIILTLLGTALAIGWWIQAIMNPVAGWLSDKFSSSRFGRRKPWLILGTPIIALSFVAVFFVPSPATDLYFPIIWLTIFAGIYNGAYAATVCVYLAMIPEICPTPEERTSISTYRTAFYLVGYILGAIIGALVANKAQMISIILATLFIIFFYIAAFRVKEPEQKIELPTFGIIEALKVTFKNKPFIPYLGFTIFATMFQSMLIGALPDFGLHVVFKGDTENGISSYIPALFVITGIVAVVPAMNWINKIGKKKATIYSMIIAAVITSGLLTVGLIPGFEFIQVVLIVLLLGIPAAPLLILPDSIISDITDYDEMVTGNRREAMHFASQGLLTRFAGGIAVQLMGFILGNLGATYNVTEPFNGVLGLLMIGPFSALLLILGVVIFSRYPEDEVLAASKKKLEQ